MCSKLPFYVLIVLYALTPQIAQKRVCKYFSSMTFRSLLVRFQHRSNFKHGIYISNIYHKLRAEKPYLLM